MSEGDITMALIGWCWIAWFFVSVDTFVHLTQEWWR